MHKPTTPVSTIYCPLCLFPTAYLNNTNLHEVPFASTGCNKLPHVDDMKDAAASRPKEHAILLGIVAAHRLSEQFSIHLVHKHFNVDDGRVMVYETVQGNPHGDFLLCSPRLPQKCPNMRGLYFKAAPGRTTLE